MPAAIFSASAAYSIAARRVSCPFRERIALATLRALAVETPIPPYHLCTEVPRDLSHLIMRLLTKNPSQRPQSADEVMRALDQISPTPPRARRGWLLNVVIAGLAVALLAGVFVIRIRHPDGTVSEAEVPPGSRVTVDSKDKVQVDLT